jgi:hypothetical protein
VAQYFSRGLIEFAAPNQIKYKFFRRFTRLSLLPGRAHDPAVVGGEGLRPERGPVRPDLQAREQTPREVRRIRGVRGRVQVRPLGQQLHLSRGLHSGHAAPSHFQRPVSYPSCCRTSRARAKLFKNLLSRFNPEKAGARRGCGA